MVNPRSGLDFKRWRTKELCVPNSRVRNLYVCMLSPTALGAVVKEVAAFGLAGNQ